MSAVVYVYRPGPVELVSRDEDGLHVNAPQQVNEREILTSSYQLSNGFFHLVVDGLLEECSHWKVETTIQATSQLDSNSLMRQVKNNDASAVLFVGPYREEVRQFIAEFPAPMVLVGVNYASRHDAVTIDNFGGIRQAVEHLAELGHRDIGFVGVRDMPDFEERRLAFMAYMQDAGLPVRDDWINLGTLQMAEITERSSKLLNRDQRPTALICGNDLTAMATIEAAKQCGLRVPEDLSVIGFDDIPVAGLVSPPLTTVHVPMQQIGRQAVRQMAIRDSCKDGLNYQGCVTRVATQLLVRQSTAPPVSTELG